MTTDQNTIKLGIIGCGVIGKIHLDRALNLPGCAVTAVCDVQESLVRETADEYDIPFHTTNPNALLCRDDVDAVILALPAVYRFELALKALENGKHLLLEKPVAMSSQEVNALIDHRGDRVVGCCSCRLSKTNAVGAARDAIREGAIGTIREIHCRVLVPGGPPPADPPPPWRLNKRLNGGGIFVNWGCYDLDFLFTIIDWKVPDLTAVLAKTYLMPPDFSAHQAEGSDAETHIAFIARYSDGMILEYERAERATTREESAWQIVGDRGTLHIDMMDPEAPVVLDRTDSQKGLISEECFREDNSTYEQHRIPVEDFIEAIRSGANPHTSLERAGMLQQLTDAVYQSADTGKPVTFP